MIMLGGDEASLRALILAKAAVVWEEALLNYCTNPGDHNAIPFPALRKLLSDGGWRMRNSR